MTETVHDCELRLPAANGTRLRSRRPHRRDPLLDPSSTAPRNSQGRNSAGSERHPSPSETVRELSALFAAAFLRWTAADQKGVDSGAQVSVDLGAAVNGPEIPEAEPRPRKESA